MFAEHSGLDPQTKKEERGESWFLGNTYHFAIGQGYLLTTPLQVNTMTQAIAAMRRLFQRGYQSIVDHL